MAYLPLSRLLTGERSRKAPAALAGGPRTWGDFLAACAGVAQAAPGGDRVVLACEDAWAFAAGFFGLLAAGRAVVVPPSFLPAALARLGPLPVLAELPPPADAAFEGALSGRVEFWTSGSTGEPKRVERTLAQVEAEIAMLHGCFGHLLAGGPFVGTVPHHHIYGCLFRILWPLAEGIPFASEPCGDPARFRQALEAPGAALVSSPAHLARLPRLLDLDALPRPPAAVFSSGGPLARADALAWKGGVTEIYGSTETGGIAWRRQDGDPASSLWTPCPDVALAFLEDGALEVDAFRAGPRPVRMEDAARPAPGGRFELLGRLDRIVKLHEKRIALPEVEAALEAHPFVVRAALVLLPGNRPCLGAVLVPSAGAPEDAALRVRALRAHLASRFEATALPRRWRFVEELPLGDRGKVTAQSLAALFRGEP